jgi:hypothetical protein
MASLPSSAVTGAHHVDGAVRMSPHDPDVQNTCGGVQAIVVAGLMRHSPSSAAVRFEELWFWTR